MTVAIYGPKVGFDSLEVVTRGFLEGAESHACLAGRVYSDATEEEMGDAISAKWAICTGPYRLALWMAAVGHHERMYLMVAPNSTWVPAALWETVKGLVDEILTPSQWAKDVLDNAAPFDIDVTVVPHALLNGHGLVPESEDPLFLFDYYGKRFHVLHLAGSSFERKGTYELLKAFKSWRLRSDGFLTMVVNPIEWKVIKEEVEAMGLTYDVAVATRLNAGPNVMRHLYSSVDILCQPSRAEAFGLIPLECLAAGTPVAMTLATGHLQYAVEDGVPIDGVIKIETGPHTDVRYDPGGTAPSVDPDAIVEALDDAFSFHEVFRARALSNHKNLLEKYTWQRMTEPLFTTMIKGKYSRQ